MRLSSLQWCAILHAVAAFAMLLFVHWLWAWPFIIASWICSGVSLRGSWLERKWRKAAEAEEALAWLEPRNLTLVTDFAEAGGRRPFEPFCECPRCHVPTWHVFSGPRQEVESRPQWVAGPGRMWVEEDVVEMSVWNREGTYRVRQRETGEVVTKKQVVMVMDRECLSCEFKWQEVPS